MSKTFRRKGYECTQGRSYHRRGRKTAGFYTMKDGYWWGKHSFAGEDSIATFREPTRQEYYEEFWRIHGDTGGRNYWSPGRYYRETRQTQNRSINKQELCKWWKDEDYEPMFEANPRSHLWDWW